MRTCQRTGKEEKTDLPKKRNSASAYPSAPWRIHMSQVYSTFGTSVRGCPDSKLEVTKITRCSLDAAQELSHRLLSPSAVLPASLEATRSDNRASLTVTALIPHLFPIWRILAQRGNYIFAPELILDVSVRLLDPVTNVIFDTSTNVK